MGIPGRGEMIVRVPFLEDEGAGTDRMRRALRASQHAWRSDEGYLAADPAGQVVVEGYPGRLHGYGDHQGVSDCNGIDRGDNRAGQQRGLLRVEVISDCRSVTRGV